MAGDVVKFSRCRVIPLLLRFYNNEIEKKFSDIQKEKILQVINKDVEALSRYKISKAKLKKLSEWLGKNGQIETISDIKNVNSFTEKHAIQLCNSILDGPKIEENILSKKIKGQILQPSLSDGIRQSCKSVLAVYVAVNSVCWVQINKEKYEVNEWEYYNIDYQNAKKLQITDLLNIAWDVTRNLPDSDIYVMKAEATTLRAPGSDPNNPKVLAVNLQKAQLIAMIVALINTKSNDVKLNRLEFLPPALQPREEGKTNQRYTGPQSRVSTQAESQPCVIATDTVFYTI